MEITINTIHGTFIVPSDKVGSLVAWLQDNAIKVGYQAVKEASSSGGPTSADHNPYAGIIGRQLISE
jgi:hypothetical protein